MLSQLDTQGAIRWVSVSRRARLWRFGGTIPPGRMGRFYAVGVQSTLFGEGAVISRWGLMDTKGRRSETWHAHAADAEIQAAHLVAAKRRRRYVDASGC